MTERLSNTELKRVKQQICEFIITIYYSFKARCRQKLQSNYRSLLTEIVVLEHQKWHFRASGFKNFLWEGGGHTLRPPYDKGPSALKTVSLRKFSPDLMPSGGWTVWLLSIRKVQAKLGC